MDRHEDDKLQLEWILLNLVREARTISQKGQTPTYYSAIKLARQIMPDIFDDDSLIIKRHHEPEMVRSYRQQAEAKSKIEGREVDPLELVNDRIEVLKAMASTDIEEKELIKKELDKLESVRSLLTPRNLKEDYILAHDIKSMRFGVQPLEIKAKHTDYKVSENRVIRVRLIHPNEGEQTLGADLIYEQYDPENKKVRFVVVQYKIWNGKVLYWSQAENLDPQLDKMKENICNKDFCKCAKGNNHPDYYRFPYCSAFLRPTDRLQDKNSPFTSSGIHIPICRLNEVSELTGDGNKVLRKESMRHTSLPHEVFENSFNSCQVGSRWLDYSEAEKLYKEHNILEADERIIVHIQELDL